MKQIGTVIQTREYLGGIAALGNLYREVFKMEECKWSAQIPFARIRKIVQENKTIYKINMITYVPAQDKNRIYLNKTFENIATPTEIKSK